MLITCFHILSWSIELRIQIILVSFNGHINKWSENAFESVPICCFMHNEPFEPFAYSWMSNQVKANSIWEAHATRKSQRQKQRIYFNEMKQKTEGRRKESVVNNKVKMTFGIKMNCQLILYERRILTNKWRVGTIIVICTL